MKSDPSFQALLKIFKQAWRNQAEDVDGIEKNYVSKLARQTGITRQRATRAVEGIEKLGLGNSFQEKGRRKLNILVNPEFTAEDNGQKKIL